MARLYPGRWLRAIGLPVIAFLAVIKSLIDCKLSVRERVLLEDHFLIQRIIALLLFVLLFAGQSFAQTVNMTNLNPGGVDHTIYNGGGPQKVYGMRLTPGAGTNVTLQNITISPSSTSGSTYTASDISSFTLYVNSVDDFATASLISSHLSSGNGETISFALSVSIVTGSPQYFYIAANVVPTAVRGRIFTVSLAPSDFSFSSAVGGSSSLGASGTKTIRPNAFITTWNTNNPGITNNHSITINTSGSLPNYNVYWEEIGNEASHNGTITNITALSRVIDFGTVGSGLYRVEITGTFPRISSGGNFDATKLVTIEQWGTNSWTTMASAFAQCPNLTLTAADAPKLTSVTNLHQMFQSCSSLNSDLNHWNVSTITDMSDMFSFATSFDGDISSWNVSNVTTMHSMFFGATAFNQDISGWNVGNVTTMRQMFRLAENFNIAIGGWNVGSVTDMGAMFSRTLSFNQSLNSWDVNQVTDFSQMFSEATAFNGNISGWQVQGALNMIAMFDGATVFNQNISGWQPVACVSMDYMFANTSQFNINLNSWDTKIGLVTSMRSMFENAMAFNQSLNNWDVNQVDNFSSMFAGAEVFDGDISGWTVSGGEDMSGMFNGATVFNQNISGWQTTSCLSMAAMFSDTDLFNWDLSAWDVDQVVDMSYMFSGTQVFNSGLNWNVSAVTNFQGMFNGARAFNQNITGWTTSSATDMSLMFRDTRSFNQDLSGWDIGSVTDMNDMFHNSFLSNTNYDKILIGWAAQSVQPNVTLGAHTNSYCLALAARNTLTGSPNNWTIIDMGLVCPGNNPHITSISPTTGLAGTTVTLTGTNFAVPASNNFVFFGTVRATVVGGSATSLTVLAPAGVTTVSEIIVTNNTLGLTASSIESITTPYFYYTVDPIGVSYNMNTISAGAKPEFVAMGDFNGDDNLDIVVSNEANNYVIMRLGNGDGTFQAPTLIGTGTYAYSVNTGDLNRDGLTDFVVCNKLSDDINIFYSNGDGTFNDVTYPVGQAPFATTFADVNNDGRLDILVSYRGLDPPVGTEVGILLANNSNSFNAPYTIDGLYYPSMIVPGDFDKDGNIDLVVTLTYQSGISVHRGNGTGNFSAGEYYYTGNYPSGMKAADFNGDGNLDLVTAQYLSSDLKVHFGNGSGGFTSTLTVANGDFNTVEVGDFNGDGVTDIAAPEWSTSSLVIGLGDGAGAFPSVVSIPFCGDVLPRFITATDLNKDGKPDFLISTHGDHKLYYLEGGSTAFVTTWRTTDGAITFPAGNGTFNYELKWTNQTTPGAGDGTASSVVGPHTITGLSNGDVYRLEVTGVFPHFDMQFDTNNGAKLMSVEQWGNNPWRSLVRAFSASTNMVYNATDEPVLCRVTDLSYMFSGATQMNGDVHDWDVSNVTNMAYMFKDAFAFNQSLYNWDVQNVTAMAGMFENAQAFNQDLSGWDVTGVQSMHSMFKETLAFNQDISGWNVSNVAIMGSMFEDAQAFDQNLGNWNIANVFAMDHMFDGSGLSNTNYDNILIGWAALSVIPSDVTLGAATNSYCAGETAHDLLTAGINNWTINDLGSNCNPPAIISFLPTSAGPGMTVTITGTGFSGATSVTFGGTSADSYVVVNSTTITAVIDNGSSGDVEVVTPLGTDALSGFTFVPAPAISSFTPTSGETADVITITGTNLTGATAVLFGGIPATSFTVVSATSITAVVNTGNSGNVDVTTPGGTASLAGFTFVPSPTAPTISSFSPTSAATGTTVTITGTNFTGTTLVEFGGTAAASFNVVSSTSITAVVGTGTSGVVDVTSPGGTGSLAGFTFIPAPTTPTISSFAPTTAGPGQTVTITGTNFTGTTSVDFGGTIATSFTVVSSTSITAVVGAGTSGSVTVTTPSGTISLAGFTFAVPEIAVFNASDTNGPQVASGDNINIGSATIPANVTHTFTILNSGSFVLNISSVNVTGTGYSLTSTAPATLAAGATAALTVQLSSATPGNFAGTVTIANNDSDEGTFTLALIGAILSPQVLVKNSNDNTGAPITGVTPIDMGFTIENEALLKTFSIVNVGTSNADVTSVTLSNNNFTIVEQPTSIAPNSFALLTLSLQSATPGVYHTNITITFSGLAPLEFAVEGEVENTQIEVFNAVTPNNDGAHDFLKIENIEFYPDSRVLIFDRLGHEVFKIGGYNNDDPLKRFEGKSNSGSNRTLTDGTYYYIIELNKNNKKYTGFLLLQK